MKIIVFGATGLTGRLLIALALAAGHRVTAFVRTPAKLGDLAARVAVTTGDVADRGMIEAACRGQDAAIVALGGTNPLTRAPYLTVAMHNILMAIETAGVGRLVYLSSDTVKRHRHNFFRRHILIPLLLAGSAADHELGEAMIRQSRVQWVIVRPPMLTNHPPSGRYRAGENLRASAPIHRVARADVAAFMLDQLTDDLYLRRTPSLLPSDTSYARAA